MELPASSFVIFIAMMTLPFSLETAMTLQRFAKNRLRMVNGLSRKSRAKWEPSRGFPMLGSDRPAITLTFPGPDAADRQVAAIRERGNLPLIVGEHVLAEIDRNDLKEGWAAAKKLSDADMSAMCRVAGARLTKIFEDNIEAEDLTDIVTDAAALFLLALRRYGVRTPKDIKPCTLVWDDKAGQERLLMQA
jgi:hypothetical protein